MSVSAEAQPTLWFPLFDCPNQAFNAVLASIYKMLLVLDHLAYLADECEVVADHSF
jgi:hypothetical protein